MLRHFYRAEVTVSDVLELCQHVNHSLSVGCELVWFGNCCFPIFMFPLLVASFDVTGVRHLVLAGDTLLVVNESHLRVLLIKVIYGTRSVIVYYLVWDSCSAVD